MTAVSTGQRRPLTGSLVMLLPALTITFAMGETEGPEDSLGPLSVSVWWRWWGLWWCSRCIRCWREVPRLEGFQGSVGHSMFLAVGELKAPQWGIRDWLSSALLTETGRGHLMGTHWRRRGERTATTTQRPH